MPLEVVGKEMLERVAAAAFHERECGAILHSRRIIEELKKTEAGYELRISLPFTEKKQLQLNQKGDELTLQVGSYKRIVALPRVLLGRQGGGGTSCRRHTDHTFRSERRIVNRKEEMVHEHPHKHAGFRKHCALFEEIKNIAVARLVPEAARAHFRQAEKEALLGVKSLLDAAIVRLEEDDSMKPVNESNQFETDSC